jgi:exoribonuclease R
MDYVACLAAEEERELKALVESGGGAGGVSGGAEGRFRALLCIPMDRRIPKIRIHTRQGASLVGARFVIRVDSWEANSQFPDGHLVQVSDPSRVALWNPLAPFACELATTFNRGFDRGAPVEC